MPVVSMQVNGQSVSHQVEGRTLLVDFLRETLALTGTHVGCDTSQCGACVVHVEGRSVKSCAMLAAEAEGAEVLTIEGVATNGALHPMQEAFKEHHGLQCGFCTPGMVLSGMELVSRKIFRGRMKGERRSKRKGQSVEFADFRNYVPGDDLRFIDWNLYARLEKLFLKMYLEEDQHI